MKNKMLVPLVLALTFSLLSTPAKGYAKSDPFVVESFRSQANALSKDNCKSGDRDVKAPCTTEVFSYVQEDLISAFAIAPLADLSQVVTCGVNIYNGGGTLVAILSETVYARWNFTNHYVDNSSRYSWVVNSFYGWTNLSGPTPQTGSAQFQSPVVPITKGRNTWTLGSPVDHKIVTVINGTQANPQWSCSGTY